MTLIDTFAVSPLSKPAPPADRDEPISEMSGDHARCREIADGHDRKAQSQEIAARYAVRQRRGDPRAEKQRQCEGQHAKARGGGAEREDVLQIERQIGHHDLSRRGEAEHGEARA